MDREKEINNFENEIKEGCYLFTKIKDIQLFLKMPTPKDEIFSKVAAEREEVKLMATKEEERPMSENQLKEFFENKYKNGSKKEDCWLKDDEDELLEFETKKLELEGKLLDFYNEEKKDPSKILEEANKKDKNYQYLSELYKEINEWQNKFMVKLAKRFYLLSSSMESIVESKRMNHLMQRTILKMNENGDYINYFKTVDEVEQLQATEYYSLKSMWINDFNGRYAKTND